MARVLASVAALLASLWPCFGQIEILAVTSSANFTSGRIRAGSLASIFCRGLQNVGGLIVADSHPLPLSLANVRVRFGAYDAPMLAIGNRDGGLYQQINVQVPWEANTDSGYRIEVQQGVHSAFQMVSTREEILAPAFFVDASGYAVAQHASDYRPVTVNDPARPGEWIIVYATNLGPVENPPRTGYPADLENLHPTLRDTSDTWVSYGLSAASIWDPLRTNYIGLTPGSLIYQVNFRIPEGYPTGDLEFVIAGVVDCGFFWTPGCGRGYTMRHRTLPAKVPVR
jgi:uncharacterized protein (TIGR03437 family)